MVEDGSETRRNAVAGDSGVWGDEMRGMTTSMSCPGVYDTNSLDLRAVVKRGKETYSSSPSREWTSLKASWSAVAMVWNAAGGVKRGRE